MLTRLRIQGFRNLLDVDLRLGPFTCLSGRNGSGKSGIFDTIRFLYLLSNRPIMEAAEAVRGDGSGGCDPTHLFATYGDWRAREIRFTAEMIVDQQVEDDFGVVSEASTTALQYIIGLRLVSGRVGPQLVISEEQLLPLGVKATRRGLGFPSKPIFRRVISGRRAAPFISTERDGDAGPAIQVHHEGHSSRRFPARRASRTALSGLADSEFPTILAVHREMERWRLLAVEPTALRQASGYRDPEKLGNRGEHLASTLARLERSDPNPGATLGAMAESMRLLGEDVKELRVIDDRARQTRSVEVQGRDGIFRPTWALSDATLRAMAICAGRGPRRGADRPGGARERAAPRAGAGAGGAAARQRGGHRARGRRGEPPAPGAAEHALAAAGARSGARRAGVCGPDGGRARRGDQPHRRAARAGRILA